MSSRIVLIAAFLSLLVLAAPAAAEVSRHVRFLADGKPVFGTLEGGIVHEITAAPYAAHARTGRTFALDALKLLAPSAPTKVLAVALNFRSHAGNAGAAKPELFAKFPSSLIGHDADVIITPDTDNLHYEGELVVVMGKRAKNVSEAAAGDYIFGYTAGNDISERTWQFADRQWARAKGADGFGPAGPVLVRGIDPTDLLITTRLNGNVEQSESTRHLIHNVYRVVSYASRYFTLEPGDMIFMGTPGSTRAMRPGDVIEVEIENIGVLRNRIAKGG